MHITTYTEILLNLCFKAVHRTYIHVLTKQVHTVLINVSLAGTSLCVSQCTRAFKSGFLMTVLQ